MSLLSAGVHVHLEVPPCGPHPVPDGVGDPRVGSRTEEQGHQLTTPGEQPFDDGDRDVGEVGTHHGDVPLHQSEGLPGAARSRGGHGVPLRHGHRALPRGPRRRRHPDQVVLDSARRVVHRRRGESLDLRPRRQHGDPQALLAAQCRRGLGPGHGLDAVGQDDDGRGPGPPCRGENGVRRRLTAVPARDDHRTRCPEQGREPRSGGAGHHAEPGGDRPVRPARPARSARSTRSGGGHGPPGDLLGEVGDPDPVRTSGGDPRLDGSPRVVHVHVHVPQGGPVPGRVADHHEGVTEPGQPVAQGRQGLGGRVEQVHDLVGRAGVVQVGAGRQVDRRQGRAPVSRPPVGPPLPADQVVQCLDQDDESPAAGVDHPCPPQHLQLARGAGQCGPRPLQRPGDHVGQRRAGVRDGERRGPAHGEDGALDGLRHRGPGEGVGVGEGLPCGLAVHLPVLAEHVGPAPEQLGGDRPGTALRPEQGPPGEGVRDGAQVRRGRELGDRGAGRLQGEVEVRPGVAVGDRKDVEGVDLLPGAAEPGEGQPRPAAYRRRVDHVEPGPHAYLHCHRPAVVSSAAGQRRVTAEAGLGSGTASATLAGLPDTGPGPSGPAHLASGASAPADASHRPNCQE